MSEQEVIVVECPKCGHTFFLPRDPGVPWEVDKVLANGLILCGNPDCDSEPMILEEYDPDEPRSEADYIDQELEKMNDDGTTELE